MQTEANHADVAVETSTASETPASATPAENRPTAPATDSATDSAPSHDADPSLGFLELMRTPATEKPATDPTDRVLARSKRSAWDY